MLKYEIEKQIQLKNNLKKFESTQVNLLYPRLESWYHDNSIERKLKKVTKLNSQ